MSSLSLWCTFTCLAPPSKSQLHLFVVCFVPFISGPLSVAHSVISLLFTLLQCRPHLGSAFSPPFSFLASPSQSRPHFCIAHLMYLISGSLSAVHLVIFLLVILSSSPWCVFFFFSLSFFFSFSPFFFFFFFCPFFSCYSISISPLSLCCSACRPWYFWLSLCSKTWGHPCLVVCFFCLFYPCHSIQTSPLFLYSVFHAFSLRPSICSMYYAF